jgi:hypothetical protein
MIGYATIGTKDMEKAKAFWSAILASKGARVLMDIGRIAFIGVGMDQPMLAVCVPYDENDPTPATVICLHYPLKLERKSILFTLKPLSWARQTKANPAKGCLHFMVATFVIQMETRPASTRWVNLDARLSCLMNLNSFA